MGIPWKKLALKLGGWLLSRGEEEVVKEVDRQLGGRSRPPETPLPRSPRD